MVDNVSYEYMCFFLAGGLRTSEGNFLLHWRVACGLVEAGVHVERRRSGLQLQLPSGLKGFAWGGWIEKISVLGRGVAVM